MIQRFSDHAANERTYLAWLRSAIAFIGLGFVVEKFDILLAGKSVPPGATVPLRASQAAELVAVALMGIGVVMVLGSTLRFLRYRQAIESDRPTDYGGARADLVLGVLLSVIGVFLCVWVIHTLFG